MKVLEVRNLGKQYRLGQMGSGTLSHDLNRWIAKIRGKEDPYSKIGKLNDRSSKVKQDYIWALRDLSFELEEGDVLGVIGRNGAGKSTLLKLLSQITSPTEGSIRFRGKMSSLLEVGTGFHPELSGRENIFLNGAILGMSKLQIKKQFDSIVDFSGCSAYIDTPVKRYSSGMLVRLGFSVAAHLDTDILIVDEVLAVGDLEFQQKCLGKMSEVSKSGRTVLFVSHNMQAVGKLCNKGLYLKNGILDKSGLIDDVIESYIKSIGSANFSFARESAQEQHKLDGLLVEATLLDSMGISCGEFAFAERWSLNIKFRIEKDLKHVIVAVSVLGAFDEVLNTTWTTPKDLSEGVYELILTNDVLLFTAGGYSISIGLSSQERGIDYLPLVLSFSILDTYRGHKDERIARLRGNGFVANQMTESLKLISRK